LRERFGQTLGRDRVGQVAHKKFSTHSKLWAGGRTERNPGAARRTVASERAIDR
jgi:hypothetical protein